MSSHYVVDSIENFSGTNDALVTISLEKEKYQTSVKERAKDPVEWSEQCELYVDHHHHCHHDCHDDCHHHCCDHCHYYCHVFNIVHEDKRNIPITYFIFQATLPSTLQHHHWSLVQINHPTLHICALMNLTEKSKVSLQTLL